MPQILILISDEHLMKCIGSAEWPRRSFICKKNERMVNSARILHGASKDETGNILYFSLDKKSHEKTEINKTFILLINIDCATKPDVLQRIPLVTELYCAETHCDILIIHYRTGKHLIF